MLCDRSFGSEQALNQHLESPIHAPSLHCDTCDRSFGSGQALEQHLNSRIHAPSFGCETCDRSFNSEQALEQHLNSRIYAPSFKCETCDRPFDSEQALEQHLRNSPIHAPSFDCETCGRSFKSKQALEQHLNSRIHAPSFKCETCDRPFNSKKALEQHLHHSRVHRQDTETPLDAFFRTFPTFDYDPALTPSVSYAKLQKHERWWRGDPESKKAWARYQDALERELHLWFGAEDDLTAWHALCRAIGIQPLPGTCGQCEKVGDPAREFGGFMLT